MTKRLALVAAVVACWSTVAGATSLDLPRQNTPDICSFYITTQYTEATGVLTALGFALQLNEPPTHSIIPGPDNFALSVRVDSAGALQEPGTLQITGGIPDKSIPNGTVLLTGEVIAIGFPDPGDPYDDPLEFVFSVIGGELAPQYGGAGALGGVTLSYTGFDRSSGFTQDFSMHQGLSDTYVIPEPITALLAVPVVVLARTVRRRTRAVID